MMPLRSVIVDDEPEARDLLADMLRDERDVEVVGLFGDGTSALAGIRDLHPDVVFLDVHMPRATGLDVAESLAASSESPLIVFVTAYDEYAVRAFDSNATDYLLKPFDEERLARAVARVVARKHTSVSTALAARRALAEAPLERIPVRSNDRTLFVRLNDVRWFEADGKHIRLHRVDSSGRTTTPTIRYSMQALERLLDPARFLRISRFVIVNIERIAHAEPWPNGEFVVVLDDGSRVFSTHTYRTALHRLVRLP